jgi:succinoglycan biosynthesis protein ExoV
MRLFYFTEGKLTNFGDDLNRWLWEELLPGRWNLSDDVAFAGIGTIISRAIMPDAQKWVVFSSGVGYAPPPRDFGDPNWNVVAVRGPLTCRLLGLPPKKGIVDGAALLSALPRLAPLSEADRYGIVFMPHYESLRVGNWKEVCRRSGFEFLDPHADSKTVVERIRSAKLVLADAMHAAIVADSLRVPWIPLVTSPQINTLKWLDWTMSIDVRYRPTSLPASSPIEVLRNRTLGWYGERFNLQEPSPEQALKHYESSRKIKETWWWKSYAKWCRRACYTLPGRVVSSAPVLQGKGQKTTNLVEKAAAALVEAAAGTAYLSSDRTLYRRTEELMSRLQQFT